MSIALFNLQSQCLGFNTEFTVILPDRPPRTDAAAFYGSGKKYPVLWLLHGGGEDHTAWLRKSRIELYAQENNLVVVMPAAYNSAYANWATYGNGMMVADYFFKELMPFVHNWLPASDKREDNFLGGLSMGGQGVLKFSLAHPECFGGCVMLSSRAEEFPNYYYEQQKKRPNSVTENMVKDHGGIEAFMASPDDIGSRIREIIAEGKQDTLPEIYHSIGTADGHFNEYLEFKAFCREVGFARISFHEVEGYAHEWRFWDQAICHGLNHFGFNCRL